MYSDLFEQFRSGSDLSAIFMQLILFLLKSKLIYFHNLILGGGKWT